MGFVDEIYCIKKYASSMGGHKGGPYTVKVVYYVVMV